jgi:small subunit ribosomal protein S16
MLRIRLRRVGKKKKPAYRVVVADSRAPRDGAFVEILGLYDPLTDPPTINVDEAKTSEWLRKGAQPSETVAKLLKRKGISAVVAATEPAPAEPAAEPTA